MAQPLDDTLVRHVAHLARLELTNDEVACFGEQLTRILHYVEQLNELDTSDVPPSAHARSINSVYRDDAIRPSCDSDRALTNAPERQERFFRVPKVLDQGST